MSSPKKRLGIISGLGPVATGRLLEVIVAMTEPDTMDIITCDFPSIPDRTGYIPGSNLRSPLPGLLTAGRTLARQGADCIAIPCMTAHYFSEELNAGIPALVINPVQETVNHLKQKGITAAGIMATDGTLASNLFIRELIDAGIWPVLPSEEGQSQVMHLIYRNIKAGMPAEMERFRRVEAELRKKGAQAIILGSTELSLLKRDAPLEQGFLDTMEVLARQSVLCCGGKLKEEYNNLIT